MDKNVKIGIILAVLIFLALLGFVYNNKHSSEENNFVKEVQRNLSNENRKVFEDRIIDQKNKIAQSSNPAEKYNLYIQLGFNAYALGHLEESKNYFDEAIKIANDQFDVYTGLFQTQLEMQDYAGAEVSIKKAISIRKGIADLWRKYIEFKIDKLNASNEDVKKLYDDALRDVTQYGDAANYTDIVTSYATRLEKMGDFQGAIDNWEKAISANPESSNIYEAEIDRIKKLIK